MERLPERAPFRLKLERGQNAVGVGADGEESGIPEVQQASETDDDVQPQRQRGIGGCVRHAVDVGVVGVHDRERQRAHDKDQEGDAAACRLGDAGERSGDDRDSSGSRGIHVPSPFTTCLARRARTDPPV